ncbi:MAG: class I SAM-dependent DNA methyltransferase [Chloroflexi bacterium]|nr:class I SAM-dependent DNA methyltransferase [Chloroflexota bacterium]
MTPREFIDKWRRVELKERSMAQEHFIDICRLVGHPTPAEADPTGEWFVFEAGADKTAGGHGWADVWKRGYFAWEYKGPDRDLDAAYNQLLQYRESLENPPLLVVSDHLRFRIHTNWTNTVKRVYEFTLEDLTDATHLNNLRALFHNPERLHPHEQADKMTEAAAAKFAGLADELRRKGHAPRKVAHFLTQVLFCFFAEDIGLLAPGPDSNLGIFSWILKHTQREKRHLFPSYTRDLFRSMATGGNVLTQDIRHFNGGLFTPGDEFWVPELTGDQLSLLYDASRLDWSAVEPSIFGTLFERGLDPAKRSQIGAHYTSKDDIKAIVEPVLMAPLRREWAEISAQLPADNSAPGPSAKERQRIRDGFLKRLSRVRVLDPACGSGNFLYVSLGLLKDLEKQVITHPAFEDLPDVEPRFVTPQQLYGIEISEYAHELASVVVWIGYIQWFRNNGYLYDQKPVLQKLSNIECKDAILGVREDGTLYKPDWPEVDVIVGNPPFLGDKKMRGELGDEYVDAVRGLYKELPGQSDLVCYWFERARERMEQGRAKRAGLLATQAIRGGANRRVLEAIKDSGDIFFAHSDREWILEGASVRVSMVGFDDGTETQRQLDGAAVNSIHADLSAGADLTQARRLPENQGLAFLGITKNGTFELPDRVARTMLQAPVNPNGRPNSDVIKEWVNGSDITGRPRGMWIIDFGVDMPLEQAAQYEMPFEYVKKYIYPARQKVRRERRKRLWWLFAEPAPNLRVALSGLSRYIGTPRVAKHRVFTWIDPDVIPDMQVVVFARDDDYFFGVLHSKAHELWALRQGTQLESRPRYTPTTTFETFPLPWPPGSEPVDDPRYQAIAEAARELNEKREAWLNPPNAEVATLKARTLTNLYNAMPTWLQHLHEKLDRAVFAAYGWDYDDLHDAETGALDEEEILRRLLALNLERAGVKG